METEALILEKLHQLEERLLRPEIRSSKEELMILLADDFVEFGSSGRIFYKQQITEALTHSLTEHMKLMDFQVKILASDVVLTTFRVVKPNEPREAMRNSLRSSIWKFFDDRWQMVFHQGTPQQWNTLCKFSNYT
ncbi:DUF4440 domain-containing protein [Desulfitobacterium metallireducens]|uniref:DUF4440 domain-containing protein n=1 Tax=Desulfitobacterium metallireducens DSM 15288 TaxID=871968 RepID=W0E9N0_9FIRM|nr:DUF4440 domain-containing protein [Desulfitobacterium metallireducens]AHF06213.1 hypothetical protein DESME_03445 [Desulfitobacterium metallireducens DSM 15288]